MLSAAQFGDKKASYRIERSLGAVSIGERDHLDLATCLAIRGDEPFGFVCVHRGIRITIIMCRIRPALDPQSGWGLDRFRRLESEDGIALRHRLFRAPIGIMPLRNVVDPGRWR